MRTIVARGASPIRPCGCSPFSHPPPSQPCVCCLSLNIEIDLPIFIKSSGCKTPNAYAKIVGNISQLLGVGTILTTKELSIQYGCIQVNDLAKKVLQVYKDCMMASKPPGAFATSASDPAGRTIFETRNVYPVVAFYLSCRHLKIIGTDRRRLLKQANLTEREFQATIESFQQHIPELRPPEKKTTTKKTKGKRKKNKDDTNNGDGDDGDEEEEKSSTGIDHDEDDGNDDIEKDEDEDDDSPPTKVRKQHTHTHTHTLDLRCMYHLVISHARMFDVLLFSLSLSTET